MPRSIIWAEKLRFDLVGRKLQQGGKWLRPNYRRAVVNKLPERQITAVHLGIVGKARRERDDGSALAYANGNRAPAVLALHGHTFVAKDNFISTTLPTTCASNILQGFSGPKATCIDLLEKAGAKIIATTNMDEFGMGSHSTHSAYGSVFNGQVFANSLSVGGSSGGSALVVAENMVDFALGSDTGGSVRLPAAYTNVIGFKPSYGRISRQGLIPYANSLDTVGIFCNNTWVLDKVFEVLDKPDPRDPTSLTRSSRSRISRAQRARTLLKVEDFKEDGKSDPIKSIDNQTKGVQQYRIGVPIEYNIEEIHPLVRESWMQTLAMLESYGHELTPISLPTTKQALSAYYVLAPAEASSNLAKYDGVRYGTTRLQNIPDDDGGVLYAKYRGELFGDEVKRRILLGSFSLSAGAIDNYFIQAQKVRRLVQDDFNQVFRMAHPLQANSEPIPEGIDFIVCPTAPTPPPLVAEVQKADPIESYMNDVFTVPASLAGLPAISVPSPGPHTEHHVPEEAVGIQIIGQYGDDIEVIRFARRFFERDSDWHLRNKIVTRPKLK